MGSRPQAGISKRSVGLRGRKTNQIRSMHVTHHPFSAEYLFFFSRRSPLPHPAVHLVCPYSWR